MQPPSACADYGKLYAWVLTLPIQLCVPVSSPSRTPRRTFNGPVSASPSPSPSPSPSSTHRLAPTNTTTSQQLPRPRFQEQSTPRSSYAPPRHAAPRHLGANRTLVCAGVAGRRARVDERRTTTNDERRRTTNDDERGSTPRRSVAGRSIDVVVSCECLWVTVSDSGRTRSSSFGET